MNQRDKPNRWRVRFTVRFLVIALTLLCMCLAGWKPLKRIAFDDVQDYEMDHFASSLSGPSSPFPLIVCNDGIGPNGDPFGDSTLRRYYVWLFGYVVQLPYERKLNQVVP